jgi:hypothetical protein
MSSNSLSSTAAGAGPTVPYSTLLRDPVLVVSTFAMNCLPTTSSSPLIFLWKSLPRHASYMVQAFEPWLIRPVSSSRLA